LELEGFLKRAQPLTGSTEGSIEQVHAVIEATVTGPSTRFTDLDGKVKKLMTLYKKQDADLKAAREAKAQLEAQMPSTKSELEAQLSSTSP
jgi:hypothetical protein